MLRTCHQIIIECILIYSDVLHFCASNCNVFPYILLGPIYLAILQFCSVLHNGAFAVHCTALSLYTIWGTDYQTALNYIKLGPLLYNHSFIGSYYSFLDFSALNCSTFDCNRLDFILFQYTKTVCIKFDCYRHKVRENLTTTLHGQCFCI